MQNEPAQILQFPKAPRRLSIARITEFRDGFPTKCTLTNDQQTLNIVAVYDMPHEWQENESVNILHNNTRAIVIGCNTAPDNQFNLSVQIQGEITNLESNNSIGERATHCQFLCGATNILISSTTDSLIDFETFDNNSLWCLLLLGFKINVS